MVYILLADGFEETEALAPCDILRRGGVDAKLVSCTGQFFVKGSHGIGVNADLLFEDIRPEEAQMVVIPGGMPGTLNLDSFSPIDKLIEKVYVSGGCLAAICAGPIVLGKRGYLNGRKAVCYPGFEQDLCGAEICACKVVRDGRIITAAAAGAALDFGLELLSYAAGQETSDRVRKSVLY